MTSELTDDEPTAELAHSGSIKAGILGALIAMSAGLIFIYRGARWHPINSDDVAWQVALQTWRPGAETLVLPENSYLLKFPLFLVANAVGADSVGAIVIESMLLNAVALFLVWHFARYAAIVAAPSDMVRSRWSIDVIAALAVAFTWASSELTWDLASRLTNRNLEIGLIAALLEFLHRQYVSREQQARLGAWHAVTGIALGIVIFNDPLLAYSLVVPSLIVVGVLVILGRWRPNFLIPTAICLIGLVAWKATAAVARLVGVDQVALGARFAGVEAIPKQVGIGLDGLARSLGITVFYADPGSESFLLGAIRLAVLGFSLAIVIASCRASRRPDAAIAATGWALALFCVFVLSTHGGSLINIRYLAVVVAAFPAVIAACLVRLRGHTFFALTAVLIALTGWNLVSVLDDLSGPDGSPNDLRQEMASALRNAIGDEATDTAVFGDFWDSHVHSYFTGLDPQVLAVGCASGVTVPRYWISDFSRFSRPPSKQSIFIYNPEPGLFTCPRDDLLAQFGVPDTVVPVRDKELWIFDRDLGLFN